MCREDEMRKNLGTGHDLFQETASAEAVVVAAPSMTLKKEAEELRRDIFRRFSPENLVERGEFALLFDWTTGRTVPFKDRKDERLELPFEFGLVKCTSELVRHDIARQLVHAAAERAKDNAVMSVLQGDAVDGANLVELDCVALRRESAVAVHVLTLFVAVVVRLAEAERGDRDHAAGERLLTKGIPVLEILAEEHDARRIDSTEVDVQRVGVEPVRNLRILHAFSMTRFAP